MRRILGFVLCLAACGDDDGAGVDVDAPSGADAARSADARPAGDGGFGGGESGRLRIFERKSFGGYTDAGVFGELMVGGLYAWHQETMASGDCRLLEYEPQFCDPACDGVCAPGNVCDPYPVFASAGDIVVTGLNAAVTMSPSECGFCTGQQYYGTGSYPTNLFDDDASVTASAAGDTFPAFTVSAGGVPPLGASFAEDKITLVDGVDYTIGWTPAAGDARVRVTINANNQGHGAPYRAIIQCDGPDTGSLVIPGTLISAFPPTMAWAICAGSDCPPSSIMRYRRGTAEAGGGTVELTVGSEVLFGVDHQ